MFRNRQEYKIKVDDLKPNTGIGISLPFSGTNVFNSTYTTMNQVKSNLINFLLTNRGERPFNPEFGADLKRSLFEQMTSVEQLKDIISDRIRRYIPQITISNLDILRDDDRHTINLQLAYSVNKKEDTVTIQFV